MIQQLMALKHLSKACFTLSKSDKQKLKKIENSLDQRYPSGSDAWGLKLDRAKNSLEWIYPFYKHYFRVRAFGTHNVKPESAYIVVSNHSGQIAIDGMLISTCFVSDVEPPRILRAMVDRFFTAIPFLGPWAAEGGAVLGDRQNCIGLLKRNESVLVFPEGVEGITKSPKDFYQLKSFTHGFYRMALATNTPILPISVIGAEEFYPYVFHARSLAKKLGLPALPLSPNLIPLPSPVDIWIGEPIYAKNHLFADSPDKEISEEVYKVEKVIKDMIKHGLENRRPFWAAT